MNEGNEVTALKPLIGSRRQPQAFLLNHADKGIGDQSAPQILLVRDVLLNEIGHTLGEYENENEKEAVFFGLGKGVADWNPHELFRALARFDIFYELLDEVRTN